jgi:hypothetical protein
MYKSFVTAVCLVLSGLCFADRDKSGGDGLLTDWVEIANSLTDFGSEQGENNWWYMWSSEVKGARQEMTYFENCGHLWQVECATATYCHISPWGQHPDVSPGLRMPVRRYVFQESGTYRINLWLQHDLSGQTSSCVEGVTLYALIDGQEVWSAVTVQNTDNLFEYTGDFEVNTGTIFELVSHPHQYDCSDGHDVSIVIEAAQVDCPDINGDGSVGITDLLAVIDVWGCSDCNDVDVNLDGIVNRDDLIIVFNAWGACP